MQDSVGVLVSPLSVEGCGQKKTSDSLSSCGATLHHRLWKFAGRVG